MNMHLWRAAFRHGRELGIYGDFLFSQQTQGGRGILATVQGPVFGLFEEALDLTQGNAIQALQGKDPRFEAELVRLLKGILPLTNLWYTKAATDRLIFNNLQELINPGYLNSMRARQRRQFGTTYFFDPGEFTPSRAPDFEKAIGN